MSMNLYLKSDVYGEVDLWQTPTYITYMIMVNDIGKLLFEITNKKEALRCMHSYLEWVKSHTNGVWTDLEEYENMKESVKTHYFHIQNVLTRSKKLTVYML